eukprot:TRINITY_DN4939_c0_g1_i1.p1 TRINITY_DN4939_c0_g1~~TRINITY_DN4939_c0_g1_i1.p1  ORF type:complete len:481 (-),score=129.60 TRINITY_DN4939_c0_g1_i1:54-1496(-)
MSRLRYPVYLTILSLSIIFTLGFFKETFLLNAQTFGTPDPIPREMYGVLEESRVDSKEGKRPPVKVQFRKLLNGQGKVVFKKKTPFMKDYYFSFLDLGKKGLRNPVTYGVKLFKYLLNQEYSKEDQLLWEVSTKYDPKKASIPASQPVPHPIASKFKVGDNLPKDVVRQIHIATSWRSGSTFLGDLLNHIMGTYYSFEPLHFESLTMPTERRLELMRGIFQCDFSNKEVIGWMRHVSKRENTFLFGHNFRSFKICDHLLPGKVACFMDKFQEPICSMSPFRIIKTVRLRAQDSEYFLSRTKDFPNYKMVVLVRDPRGTLHSRSHRAWCSGDECINSTVVCKDLEKDAEAAYELAEKYPGRVYLIRYEDICIQPHEEIKSLFKFLDVPLGRGLELFIQKHMFWKKSQNNKNPYSTYRNSNSMYMKWRNSVDMSYIHKIQSDCSEPMATLGYRLFSSPEERDNFNVSVLSRTSEALWPKNLS